LTGFGQLALNASFWRRGLAAMGQHIGWWPVLHVMARSIPARYVPGSVWYAASRVGMLRAAGVGMRALGVTALLETVLTVIVSMTLGAALLGAAGRLPGDRLSGVVWALALVVLVSPPVLNRLLAWVSWVRASAASRRAGSTWRASATPDVAPRLSWADQWALVAWMAVYWLLSAVTFTLYLLAFGLDVAGPAVIAGTFLVAWVIGFLTPIAPQGAGAFEAVFVALLAPPAPGAAIVVVAGFRALIGVRDALAFGWAAWRGRQDAPVIAPDDDPARPAPPAPR
ncbi:MAG TPA: lysylphosphatidylglycerol synthase domain-containing protein, partial [Euzebyales bacterium]|nr:lysylphosphatidylglycerol synthase domain-containing protein [Euzebyales bacterium]